MSSEQTDVVLKEGDIVDFRYNGSIQDAKERYVGIVYMVPRIKFELGSLPAETTDAYALDVVVLPKEVTVMTEGSQLSPEELKEYSSYAEKVFAEKYGRPRETREEWAARIAAQLVALPSDTQE